jgi:hypothetical protein
LIILIMFGLLNFWNKIIFYSEELQAPRPTPKLEDHPLSAVCNCLFNILAGTLHIWRPFPPSATWRRTMPWWITHIIKFDLLNSCYYILL